ncbi:MAG: FkbM family methyltransferase [Chloroflexota bacterium]
MQAHIESYTPPLTAGTARARRQAISKGLDLSPIQRWLTAVAYYLASLFTLLTGLRQPLKMMILLTLRRQRLTEVQLRQAGWRFRVRTALDLWIIKETCLDAGYLWPGVRLAPHWRVVDIGAGLGDFTVLAAAHCSQGVVHAYEPLAESFALLEHNLTLNRITNVLALPLAVASRRGQLAVESAGVAAVSTRFVKKDASGDTVTAVGLSEVVEALPDRECDFLKMDCEGGEFDILFNSPPETLARIARISLEYHDGFTSHTGDEIARYLTQRGFHVKQRRSPVHSYLGFLYAERLARAGQVASSRRGI